MAKSFRPGLRIGLLRRLGFRGLGFRVCLGFRVTVIEGPITVLSARFWLSAFSRAWVWGCG